MRVIVTAVAISLVLLGCGTDGDPRWQLHHDRIVGVRTTPSHVPASQTAAIDALVTSVDGGLAVQAPVTAGVAPGTPLALAQIVQPDGHGGWQLTAPDAATLAAARSALGLAADAPVPVLLTVQLTVGGEALAATKQAWLGDARDNPSVGAVTLDGAPTTAAPLSVAFDTDVVLAIDAPDDQRVNWLTSCGTLDVDDNEATAKLRVEPDDAFTGQLVVVVRDAGDGIAWQWWSIASAPPPVSANR